MPAGIDLETQTLFHLVGKNPLLDPREAISRSQLRRAGGLIRCIGGNQNNVEPGMGFPDRGERFQFLGAMRAGDRPEGQHKRFALPLGENFRQTTGNERPHGFGGGNKRCRSNQKRQEKISNREHGLPTHAKTCKNSGK